LSSECEPSCVRLMRLPTITETPASENHLKVK
jgi:hypothetical protein